MINSDVHTSLVDIFDDFDDPINMESTFCDQVSEQQYQEEIQSETDKALGLSFFFLVSDKCMSEIIGSLDPMIVSGKCMSEIIGSLDPMIVSGKCMSEIIGSLDPMIVSGKCMSEIIGSLDPMIVSDNNPEVYARVLRKRKQEEIENSGVFSYFKSKMMSFVQGEQYQERLVSTVDCHQQVGALKAGMCKTFQYSQELKVTATRHSDRLAAKRKLQSSILEASAKNTSSLFKRRPVGQEKKNKDLSNDKAESESPRIKEVDNSSNFGNTVLSNDEKNDRPVQSTIAENGNDLVDTQSGAGHIPPPVPPPIPVHLLDGFISCDNYSGETLSETDTDKQTRQFSSNDDLTLHKPKNFFISPRSSSVPRFWAKNTNYGSVENLSTVCSGSVESLNSPFVTPSENMSAPRSKKRLRSGSSSSSTPKSALPSFKSEITSNPIKRLKVTPVNRSPGLTPLRSKSNILPSEPLHRALHSAMKAKFRNVSTPSPKSENSSVNTSFGSVFTSP
ncbi:hypothetical protein Btru_001420 [Bulinus truncatus]|nr:hypothetical protein Btru_001420 [Bulinus truncatus]